MELLCQLYHRVGLVVEQIYPTHFHSDTIRIDLHGDLEEENRVKRQLEHETPFGRTE